eukprot:2468010-Rhodomonas_salina.1
MCIRDSFSLSLSLSLAPSLPLPFLQTLTHQDTHTHTLSLSLTRGCARLGYAGAGGDVQALGREPPGGCRGPQEYPLQPGLAVQTVRNTVCCPVQTARNSVCCPVLRVRTRCAGDGCVQPDPGRAQEPRRRAPLHPTEGDPSPRKLPRVLVHTVRCVLRAEYGSRGWYSRRCRTRCYAMTQRRPSRLYQIPAIAYAMFCTAILSPPRCRLCNVLYCHAIAYAMPGTDVAYAATTRLEGPQAQRVASPVCPYGFAMRRSMRCPELRSVLCVGYAMSGTEVGDVRSYSAMLLCVRYAMPGSDVGRMLVPNQTQGEGVGSGTAAKTGSIGRYRTGECGTDVACAGTNLKPKQGEWGLGL